MITQKAEAIKKCPKCGSENLTMEKMLNGKTTCIDCGYRGIHHEFQKQIEKVDLITHEEARDVLVRGTKMVWNEPEFAEAYISQQEKKDELLELYRTYHYEPSEINQRIRTLEKELGEMK